MHKTRRILRNLNVINVILAGALFLLLGYAVLPLFGKNERITVPVVKKQPPASVPATKKAEELKTPSPTDYVIIAEQNLFHPERKIPSEKKDVAAAPPPKPEFVLYGTLLTDDLQIAYMEDRKAPQNAPTRGKKQIPVKRGESLSGYTLKEIGTDKVEMVKGEESIHVFLNDATIPKDRAISQPAGPAQNARAPQPQAPPPIARPPQQQPVVSQPGTPSRQPGVSMPQPSASSGGETPSARNAFMRLFQRRR